MLAAVITLGAAVALLSVLVLGLLRSHALILRALDELGAGLDLESEASAGGANEAPATARGRARRAGKPGPVPLELGEGVVPGRATGSADPQRNGADHAPDIVGEHLDGSPAGVEVSAPGSSTLLAFLSSGCSVCREFWSRFAEGPDELDVPAGARLVVVTQGPDNESVSSLRRLAPDGDSGVEVVLSDGGWSDYDIPGSPYFVHVESGVVTGEGSSTTWEQVRGLMGQGVADIAEARSRRGGAAGSGPAGEEIGRGSRDDLPRMDAELMAAGIHPGHPSLYDDPDTAGEGRGAQGAP